MRRPWAKRRFVAARISDTKRRHITRHITLSCYRPSRSISCPCILACFTNGYRVKRRKSSRPRYLLSINLLVVNQASVLSSAFDHSASLLFCTWSSFFLVARSWPSLSLNLLSVCLWPRGGGGRGHGVLTGHNLTVETKLLQMENGFQSSVGLESQL